MCIAKFSIDRRAISYTFLINQQAKLLTRASSLYTNSHIAAFSPDLMPVYLRNYSNLGAVHADWTCTRELENRKRRYADQSTFFY